MNLAYKKILGQFTKVLGIEKTPPHVGENSQIILKDMLIWFKVTKTGRNICPDNSNPIVPVTLYRLVCTLSGPVQKQKENERMIKLKIFVL